MKTQGGVVVQLHTFLTLAQDEGERPDSHPGCFTSWERVPPGPPGKEARWATEPVRMQWRREKIPTLPGIKPQSSKYFHPKHCTVFHTLNSISGGS